MCRLKAKQPRSYFSYFWLIIKLNHGVHHNLRKRSAGLWFHLLVLLEVRKNAAINIFMVACTFFVELKIHLATPNDCVILVRYFAVAIKIKFNQKMKPSFWCTPVRVSRHRCKCCKNMIPVHTKWTVGLAWNCSHRHEQLNLNRWYPHELNSYVNVATPWLLSR